MLSRIPQPRFEGPTPSEAITQSESIGSKYADIVSQAMSEGMRNYQAQARIQQDKQSQTAETDRLRMTLMGKDIQDSFAAAGAGNEGKVWLDKGDEIKTYMGFLAGGDKALAQSMYEGGSKAINNMTSQQLLQSGVGILRGQPAASQASAPSATQQQPSAAGTNPASMPTGAVPAPATPTAQAPQATPAAPIASTVPVQTPAAVAPAPAIATSLPEKASEFTPAVIKSLVSDQTYMSEVRDALSKQGISDAKTLSDADLLGKYPTRIAAINKTLPGVSSGASVSAKTNANSGTSTSVVQMASSAGVAKPILDHAEAGLQKLETAVTDPSTKPITAIQEAAIDRASAPALTMLKGPRYAEWVAAGGKEDVFNSKVAQLNDAMTNDPEFAKALQQTTMLSPKDAKDVMSNITQDRMYQSMVDKNELAQQHEKDVQYQTSMKLLMAEGTLANRHEETLMRLKNSKDTNERAQLGLEEQAQRSAIAFGSQYQNMAKTLIETEFKGKTPSPEDINNYLNKELLTNTNFAAVERQAAHWSAAASGEDEQTMDLSYKSNPFFSVFGINIGELAPGGTGQVPEIQPTTVPKVPVAASKTATAAPTQAQKSSGDWSTMP